MWKRNQTGVGDLNEVLLHLSLSCLLKCLKCHPSAGADFMLELTACPVVPLRPISVLIAPGVIKSSNGLCNNVIGVRYNIAITMRSVYSMVT